MSMPASASPSWCRLEPGLTHRLEKGLTRDVCAARERPEEGLETRWAEGLWYTHREASAPVLSSEVQWFSGSVDENPRDSAG
ncbi:hypothetical protein SKAU_G00073910 [Synaphobranchus kaupii]|uniref:Uncharacterized protein n=1 Tax=Synaphobranchus kaupii TaxID=118154 RepID=A0A9Q1G7S2_SYNKA|nr:hypothetical protein SKAU_G00073910 [Synaphobranchus kaupii]